MNPGNTHETLHNTEEVKPSSDRTFGLVFTGLFALIGLGPLINGGAMRPWSLAVAVAFLLVALVRPGLLAPLNRLWTRFGLLLNRVTNPIIMGAIFFLAVTPTALVIRLLGKDPLRRRFDRAAKSYWIERVPPGPAPETMKQQF